jgi:hypothetical protein
MCEKTISKAQTFGVTVRETKSNFPVVGTVTRKGISRITTTRLFPLAAVEQRRCYRVTAIVSAIKSGTIIDI